MRITRIGAGLATVITAVLGLSLATAGPAAANIGTWRAYGNTNPITSSSSTWRCAATHAIGSNVSAQVCAIRSAQNSSYIQGAVIVRNNRSSLYIATASMDVYIFIPQALLLGEWDCTASGVAARSWSVCFGQTSVSGYPMDAVGWASGTFLGESPMV